MSNNDFESIEHFLWYTFGYIRGIIENEELNDKEKLEKIDSYIKEYTELLWWEEE